jgi:hypothetical protein
MVCGHLVFFSILECLDQEKSGNPASQLRPSRWQGDQIGQWRSFALNIFKNITKVAQNFGQLFTYIM